MSFTGWPPSMIEFYSQLEVNNTKEFWSANKPVYDDDVRAPMEALVAELSDEYGDAKIFRPFRDVRFSKDKTPYKTAVAAAFHITGRGSGGYYVRASADGLGCGGGYYQMARDQLARFRDTIDQRPRAASALTRVLDELDDTDGHVSGDQLKTAPRGYAKDHPRIDLLRYKSLTYFREFPPGPLVHTAKAFDAVRDTFRTVAPLMEWLDRHVGATQEPQRGR